MAIRRTSYLSEFSSIKELFLYNLPISHFVKHYLIDLYSSEFLQRNIKDSTLQSIPGAGHLSNLEEPELFNQHLAVFISARVNP